jgi:hypothetical protein
MFINSTFTKKKLEILIKNIFSNFGNLYTSSILDSLKLLGFYYSTNAAISINLEDLKIPSIKKELILKALFEKETLKKQWKYGLLTELECYQSTIDIWNNITEVLKNRIITYYQKFDPLNNLYIMAFSGARGNISQVRQLVGMRGLMSDQDGNIIDLPILSNFREGLSLIDYIISSYGARKGIVDTALKTADSGYLTRRLIYSAQDLLIKEYDCFTSRGLLIGINKKSTITNLIGRYCFGITSNLFPFRVKKEKEFVLTLKFLENLKQKNAFFLKIRSSLTCNSKGTICQKCYGWDLVTETLVSLGTAVGIIAAQSIGEPGTQLTMRTFHTGGIFTGETLQQLFAPFSGKFIKPYFFKCSPYRTTQGQPSLKLYEKTLFKLKNWKGLEQTIFLDKETFLYQDKTDYILQNELIAEISIKSILVGTRKLKPLYTLEEGKGFLKNLILSKNQHNYFTITSGIFWLLFEKHIRFDNQIKTSFNIACRSQKAFAILKIITPINGILTYQKNNIQVHNSLQSISLNLSSLMRTDLNYSFQIFPIVQNYQFVDKATVCAYIYLFSKNQNFIFSIQEKKNKNFSILSLLEDKIIWKLNTEQINNYYSKKLSSFSFNSTLRYNVGLKYLIPSLLLITDGFTTSNQEAFPTYINKGNILTLANNNSVKKETNFAFLLNYSQQTEDIVQGLPKIEELIEAQNFINLCKLAKNSGVFLIKNFSSTNIISYSKQTNKFLCYLTIATDNQQKNNILAQRLLLNKNLVFFNKNHFQFLSLPLYLKPNFYLLPDITYIFEYNTNNLNLKYDYINQPYTKVKITINRKYNCVNNKKISLNKLHLFTKVYKLTNLPFSIIYKNNINKIVCLLNTKNYIFLQNTNSLDVYSTSLQTDFLPNLGSYIDLGEPLTEGKIDIYKLLKVFYFYHVNLDGIIEGTLKALNKFQLILINSIHSIYISQGVNISTKHIEIIIRQLTTKASILQIGNTPFFIGEKINLILLTEIAKTLKETNFRHNQKYKLPKYIPLLQGITKSSLTKDGFLAAAGFQATKMILTQAAIEGKSDWLRGLKESLLCGKLLPSGTSGLNYKNYLDQIYSFKY